MRVLIARRRSRPDEPGVIGLARVDRSTAALAGRLRAGEVAVLDHLDLDRASAERLLDRGVAAVVNCAPSLSGRHPALGAALLVDAGVPLLDGVGAAVLGSVRDGQRVRLDLDAGLLWLDDDLLASGTVQTCASLGVAQETSRHELARCLDTLVADAADLLERESGLLLDGPAEVPSALASGRPVLLLSADPRAGTDLARLRRWCRAVRPVVVAVGGGAGAAAEAGLMVDVLVGDLDGVRERDLHAAGEVVASTTAAVARAEAAGRPVLHLPSALPPLALALAVVAGGAAPVVVAAGLPGGLDELLDGGRGEAAASVLARLRLQGRLVDADAVVALHAAGGLRTGRGGSTTLAALLVVLAAVLAALAVLVVSAPGQALVHRLAPGLALP